MYRPGGMSSDEDSDWDDNYFSQEKSVSSTTVTGIPPPEVALEEQLIDAVTAKDVEKVEKLLQNGADANFSPQDNWNPILHASYCGCYNIVKLLVEHGADVNISHEKFTPLLAICSSTRRDEDELFKCLDLLVAKGANVNSCDWYRVSALSHAVRHCRQRLAIKLIEEGADVNVIDQDGWSPIFYAVDIGNADMVSLLKNAEADIYVIEKRGRTLFDFALEKENLDVINLLSGGLETEKWDIPLDSKYNHSNIYKRILSAFPGEDDRLSGFMQDVFNILTAVQLAHLNKIFYENRVGLGHFLSSDDLSLKNIGVKFWFERRKILRTVEKFHEYPWCMSSFGSVVSLKELDLFEIAQLMGTLTRQLYLISVASYWWNKQGGIDINVISLSSDIKESLRTVKVFREKLKLLQSIVKKIDNKENIIPSDIILPSEHSSPYRLLCKVVLTCVTVAGIFLIKRRQTTFLLPSAF